MIWIFYYHHSFLQYEQAFKNLQLMFSYVKILHCVQFFIILYNVNFSGFEPTRKLIPHEINQLYGRYLLTLSRSIMHQCVVTWYAVNGGNALLHCHSNLAVATVFIAIATLVVVKDEL